MIEVKEAGRYPWEKSNKKDSRLKPKKADKYSQSIAKGLTGMLLERLDAVGIDFPKTLRVTINVEVLDRNNDVYETKSRIYNADGFFANLEEEPEDE